ncbi:unnamed protein product [Closterium sp. Yama58-4]|nr:unnamed protein product [Closterium sp. Yama58-4]
MNVHSSDDLNLSQSPPFPFPDEYSVKLRPAKANGKVIGDKGARGKMLYRVMRYSPSSYTTKIKVLLFNLKGGDSPVYGFAGTCSGVPATTLAFLNITRPKAKRFSWKFESEQSVASQSAGKAALDAVVTDAYGTVGRAGNKLALCGPVFYWYPKM